MHRTLINACGIALILAAGAASAQSQSAEGNQLDVTMRVLDDVSEIDGVILAIGAERDAPPAEAQAQAADARSVAAGDAAESLPDLASNELDVVAEVDRDEDAETALEDFDIPEDLDLD